MSVPIISIVIPVYKAEQWLERCLDSVCGQTFKDLEIICVNDASPDGSLDILKVYAQRDVRLVIINLSENQGEGGARNRGLDAATGAYIGFVDSDDTIPPDFYSALYATMVESGADMVEGGTCVVDAHGRTTPHPHWSWLWSCLYRSAFLRGRCHIFPVGFPVGADVLFMARVYASRPKRCRVSSVCYNYHQIAGSASHHMTETHIESLLSMYAAAFDEIMTQFREKRLDAESGGSIFRDFFISLTMQAKFRLPEVGRERCALTLLQKYAACPFVAPTDEQLAVLDPILLRLLRAGDTQRLASYLRAGRKHVAASLRERCRGIERHT